MEFDKLVALLQTHGILILAVTVIVAPISWAIARWLHANRLEELAADNRRLKAQLSPDATTAGAIPAAASSAGVTPGGVAHGEWLELRSVHGATYVYKVSLIQTGDLIKGTATVTRSGTDPYEQPFEVNGREFAGCVLLLFTSTSRGSTSAASALLRVAERGARLAGQWAYRARQSDNILTESLSLSRQTRP